MTLPRTHIHLGVDDFGRSTAFYEALFGTPPSSRSVNGSVFELDEPPVLLVLEGRAAQKTPNEARRLTPRRDRGRKNVSVRAAAMTSPARYALVVREPEHVGRAAVALWRVGAPLRLQDQGIETMDPDGNTWKVRCVPFARQTAVVAMSRERSHASN